MGKLNMTIKLFVAVAMVAFGGYVVYNHDYSHAELLSKAQKPFNRILSNQRESFKKIPIKPRASLKKIPVKPTESFKKVSDKTCTFGLFRRAYKSLGYFPSGGRWIVTDGVPHYQPDVCKFRYPRVPRKFVTSCLSKANVSYILTMGDSTGARYSSGLRKASGLKFAEKRRESDKLRKGLIPDKKYFSEQLPAHVSKHLQSTRRFCGSCASNLNIATFAHENKSHSLKIEHLAQQFILDASLVMAPPNLQPTFAKAWTVTTQEFIFRNYLKDNYPDLFLIILPFHHAKHNLILNRLAIEIEYFKNLAEAYFPNRTRFIYLTTCGEFESRKTISSWENHLFEGMLATEKIDKMNRILFDVLKADLLNPAGRYYGFLDLVKASEDRKAWNIDGLHMKPVWYESVMSMFWETYCNSVFEDQF